MEIFIPISATESVPSFQSLNRSSIARSFGSHFRSRILVRIWPFAEEWVLGLFFPLKNKFLQALSFLLICDLHAFTSFFCKIFPCTFTLCFMHTEFAVLQEKLSIFVENFLAGKRIIARYVIVNRRPETSAVFSSFWFFTGCLCFLEIFAFIWFAERFTWGASHEERALHRRNASQIFLLGSSVSRGLRFERSTFRNQRKFVLEIKRFSDSRIR